MSHKKSHPSYLATSHRWVLALAIPASLLSSFGTARAGELTEYSESTVKPSHCADGSVTIGYANGQEVDVSVLSPCIDHGGFAAADDPAHTLTDHFVCRVHDGANALATKTSPSTSKTATPNGTPQSKGSPAQSGTHVSVDHNFVQPCDVRVVCLGGSPTCESTQQVTMVNAFPSVTDEAMAIDSVGVGHNRVVHMMRTQLDDVVSRGGTADDLTLEAIARWSGHDFFGGSQHAWVQTFSDADLVRKILDNDSVAFLDHSCGESTTGPAPGPGLKLECSTDLADLFGFYLPLLHSATSPAHLLTLLDDLQADAASTLQDNERDATDVFVLVAKASSQYWETIPNRAPWPRVLLADAGGALVGFLAGGPAGAAFLGALVSASQILAG